jgi:hypothetical protein
MATISDDSRRDHVIIPNHLPDARVYTWLEGDDGKLGAVEHAPVVAWRVPGMPLVDPDAVWAVAHGDGFYFANGIVHGAADATSFAKWQHELMAQRRQQDREHQAGPRTRAA